MTSASGSTWMEKPRLRDRINLREEHPRPRDPCGAANGAPRRLAAAGSSAAPAGDLLPVRPPNRYAPTAPGGTETECCMS